jgi:ferric-dicitrate binding protein FerR (iron transport regulator)
MSEIEDKAAFYVGALDDPDCPPHTCREADAWLAADARHREAYIRYRNFSDALALALRLERTKAH